MLTPVDDSELVRVCRNLGQRIVELRRAQGMTQQALADALRMDVRDLRRLEAGENVTVYTLVRIAQALRTEVAELFQKPATRRRRTPGRPAK